MTHIDPRAAAFGYFFYRSNGLIPGYFTYLCARYQC